jgi:hypothetical protein
LALLAALACAGPRAIPKRLADGYEHATQGVPEERRATVWVSYQIEVVAIDGAEVDYRAVESGLYYRVAFAPGEHLLRLRLNYHAPLGVVRSEAEIELPVELEPGAAYKLLDLNAGRVRERVFTPWLEPGAPADEAIEIERPSR